MVSESTPTTSEQRLRVVGVLVGLSSEEEEKGSYGEGSFNNISGEIEILAFLLVLDIAVAAERRRRQDLKLLGKCSRSYYWLWSSSTNAGFCKELSLAQIDVTLCSVALLRLISFFLLVGERIFKLRDVFITVLVPSDFFRDGEMARVISEYRLWRRTRSRFWILFDGLFV